MKTEKDLKHLASFVKDELLKYKDCIAVKVVVDRLDPSLKLFTKNKKNGSRSFELFNMSLILVEKPIDVYESKNHIYDYEQFFSILLSGDFNYGYEDSYSVTFYFRNYKQISFYNKSTYGYSGKEMIIDEYSNESEIFYYREPEGTTKVYDGSSFYCKREVFSDKEIQVFRTKTIKDQYGYDKPALVLIANEKFNFYEINGDRKEIVNRLLKLGIGYKKGINVYMLERRFTEEEVDNISHLLFRDKYKLNNQKEIRLIESFKKNGRQIVKCGAGFIFYKYSCSDDVYLEIKFKP